MTAPVLTGLVLAGGQGTRMGGRDKGLVAFRGQPLAWHTLTRLRTQTEHQLISANRNVALYQHWGIPVVTDTFPGFAGPLAGIASALEHAEWLLSAPCDTPFLPLDLAARLSTAAFARHPPVPLAVCVCQDRAQPLLALWHHSLRATLYRDLAAGQRAVLRWQQQQPVVWVDFSDQPHAFANFNTLAELEAAGQGPVPL